MLGVHLRLCGVERLSGQWDTHSESGEAGSGKWPVIPIWEAQGVCNE